MRSGRSPEPVGSLPYNVAIDTFHGKVYVANYLGGSVSVIDEDKNTVATTITGISNTAHDIAVDPAAGKVYVVTVSPATLWVIDRESNTVINNSVEVIDPNTLTVTATIPLTTPDADWMTFEPIGRKLYVTGSRPYQEPTAGAVFVVDTATNTSAKTIPTPQNTVTSIAIDPVSRTVYVANADYASYAGG
jgi:YVTN family beta-propeller protein